MSSNGFDIDSLTLGEIARVEDISKMSIKRFSDPDSYVGRMTAALAYVVKRRTEPTFQFDQALDLTQHEVNELLNLGDDEDVPADPTQPGTTPDPADTSVQPSPSPAPSDATATATSQSSSWPDSSI